MTENELEIIGLRPKDIPSIKPDKLREMIQYLDERLEIWSLTKQDIEEITLKRAIYVRLLAELEAQNPKQQDIPKRCGRGNKYEKDI